MFGWFAALVACTLFATLSRSQDAGRRVDTIVDDPDPSIVYDANPAGLWGTTSSLPWNPASLHLGTYHVGLENAHARFTFAGVGVKVVIAVPDMRKTRTNITFSVDNVNMGQYFLKGSKANTLLYNITAFEASNLSNTTHVLDIVGGKGSDAMYLDYIQYTQLPPNATSTSITSSTSTSAHTSSSTATSAQNNSPPHRLSTAGIAAIGVAGGVAVLLLGNLAIWAQRRKRKATKRPRSSDDALLRFHQDVFMPRARTDEARFTQTHPNQSSVAFAQVRSSSDASSTVPLHYKYIQAPQTSVTRGVR